NFVVRFLERAVIFVTQTGAHGEVRPHLPLVLNVADVEGLVHVEVAAFTGEGADVIGVAVDLNLAGSAGEEALHVREGIGGAAEDGVLDVLRTELDAALHRVVAVNPGQRVDEGKRVVCVWRGAAVERGRNTQQPGRQRISRGPVEGRNAVDP